MCEKKDDITLEEIEEYAEKEFKDKALLPDESNEYSDIIDGNTAEIKYLINDIIDRTGIINYLEVTLPKSTLKHVLKSLDCRMEDGLKFQLNVYSEIIMLKFFNRWIIYG